ncbi:MAG: class I SAM-dependent methyltransferase [Actinomycetota bacterium]
MSIVDLGGTVDYWVRSGIFPGRVVLVNPGHSLTGVDWPSWVAVVQADGCDYRGRGERFDLAYSNSVIEHVGGFARRQQFADRIHELAPRHWVQTPDRYFPIEPHWGVPGMQFLPDRARLWIASRWSWGPRGDFERSPERIAANEEACLMTDLVSATELRRLFPASEIWSERVAGISKSLVAIGTGGSDLRPAS